jgi:hypothetical protein
MVIRIAKGWLVRVGTKTSGPYYSKEYAEGRDRELVMERRRSERQHSKRYA